MNALRAKALPPSRDPRARQRRMAAGAGLTLLWDAAFFVTFVRPPTRAPSPRRIDREREVDALRQIAQVRQLVGADVLVQRRQRLGIDAAALDECGGDSGLRL